MSVEYTVSRNISLNRVLLVAEIQIETALLSHKFCKAFSMFLCDYICLQCLHITSKIVSFKNEFL